MKRSLITALISMVVLNANAQNATDKGPLATQPKIIAQASEPTAPVVSPPVAQKDIKPTVSEKVNNSALNMPKPVKGNDPGNTQKAVPASNVKIPDSRELTPPKVEYKETRHQ